MPFRHMISEKITLFYGKARKRGGVRGGAVENSVNVIVTYTRSKCVN